MTTRIDHSNSRTITASDADLRRFGSDGHLRIKRLLAAVIVGVVTVSGLSAISAPMAEATPTTLAWTDGGLVPTAGSTVVALGFGHGRFLAVASDGQVYSSADGSSWGTAAVGSLTGGIPPTAGYKTGIAFGAPSGIPTWVVTAKDGGFIWSSTDDGATWSLRLSDSGDLKKVAYGDGRFLVGYTGMSYRTSTDGANWEDAGSTGGHDNNAEGRMAFGDHTFVIPIAYEDTVCTRSTSIAWAESTYDCGNTHSSGGGAKYWQQIAYGGGTFVGPLDVTASSPAFWVSTDKGATWVNGPTLNPGLGSSQGITFGGGYFVLDQSSATPFSKDGLVWNESVSRGHGGTGLMAYGNGVFVGLGGSGYAYTDIGTLSGESSPGIPMHVSAVAGDTSATVTWDAPDFDYGSAVSSYQVVSTPGGFTCSSATAGPCLVSGLTNGTSYTFTVSATNAVGTGAVSSSSKAVVPGLVPNAPTAVTALAADGQATVSFTAPTNPGTSAITGYTVTSSPGVHTCTTPDVSTTTCAVTGLTNGTGYTFTVRAMNAIGSSTDSDPSTAITPGVLPGAPTDVIATAGDSQAIVSWTAPISSGTSQIDRYTVTSSPASLACTTPDGTGTTCTVAGLSNGTDYVFSVVAHSNVGNSEASIPSSSVTPVGGSSSGGDQSASPEVTSNPSPTPTPTPAVSASVTPTVAPSATPSPSVTAPAGVVLLSGSERANAQVVTVAAPVSTSAVNAPEVTVSVGSAVAPVVSGLPANTPLQAAMSIAPLTRAKASFISIGKTRSTAGGRAKVPAFKASRAGVYTIRLATPAGKAFYLKVKVTAKKASSASSKAAR